MPRALNISIQADPEEKTWQTLTPGQGGINIQDLPYRLNDDQSPKMINMWVANMTLSKRPGQKWDSIELPSNTLSIYKKPYKGYFVFHAGTKLYKKAPGIEATATEIMTGLTEAAGMFYVFNGKLLYKNGKEFIEYDGTTAKKVPPKAPVVFINRKPDGTGGDKNDDYNLLGPGFTNKFNGDGTSLKYVLTDKGLDSTHYIVTVNGVLKTLATHYTEDPANGELTFLEAAKPGAGQNNVEVIAYKTDAEAIAKIIGCKYMIAYGGENNSRLFVGGNGTGKYYYSDALDYTYFPEQNYNIAGSDSSEITGFGEQYDILAVFNEEATFGVTYSFVNGKVSFPQVTINPDIGCDCPGTIELINNRLTWLNSKKGPVMMVSTANEDERNILPIGRNINGNYDRKGLLDEANIKKAISIDSMGKYWLVINGTGYLWDYTISPFRNTGNIDLDARRLSWFIFNNIYPVGFSQVENELFYAKENRIAKFYNEFYDFGAGIPASYRMPFLDFKIINYLKDVLKAWITTRADTNSIIKMLYLSEQDPEGEPEEEDINAFSFSWSKTSWSTMTYNVINFAKTYRRKPKMKKVQRFAIEFSNDEPGADLNISEIKLAYTLSKENKEG
jgi:hypothetical protein